MTRGGLHSDARNLRRNASKGAGLTLEAARAVNASNVAAANAQPSGHGLDGAHSLRPLTQQSVTAVLGSVSGESFRSEEAPPLTVDEVVLPLSLRLSVHALLLSSDVCNDSGVQRLQLRVDLLGISNGIYVSPRWSKPFESDELEISLVEYVPIYHWRTAATCLCAAHLPTLSGREMRKAASSASASAAEGKPSAKSVAASGAFAPMASGERVEDAVSSTESQRLRFSLHGIGRGGSKQLGTAVVPLSAMLPAGQEAAWLPLMSANGVGGHAARPHAAVEGARVLIGCQLVPPPRASGKVELARAQGSHDPQMSVHVHALRMALHRKDALEQMRGGSREGVNGRSVAGVNGGDLESLLHGQLDEGETQGGFDRGLDKNGAAATAAAAAAPGVRVRLWLPGVAAPVVSRPLNARLLEVSDTAETDGEWSVETEVDLLLQVELYDGNEPFGTIRSLLASDPAVGRRGELRLELVLGAHDEEPSPSSLSSASRMAHAAIDLATLISSESDLVMEPIALRDEAGVVAQITITIAVQSAVQILQASAHSARVAKPLPKSGAGIAVGAGESFLLGTVLRALRVSAVWVEADLRRACGTLLRSKAQPTGSSRIDFALRDLLVVVDGTAVLNTPLPKGSTQQRRLALLLNERTPAEHTRVRFTVLGSPQPPRARTRAGQQSSSPLLPPVVVGTATVDLREIMRSGLEPLCDPLPLVDDGGGVVGMLCVSLLARHALQRARRSLTHTTPAASVRVSIGALDLRGCDSLSSLLGSVWLEARLVAAEEATAVVRSRPVDAGVGAQPVGARGVGAARAHPLAESLPLSLKEEFRIEAGSALRSALQRVLASGVGRVGGVGDSGGVGGGVDSGGVGDGHILAGDNVAGGLGASDAAVEVSLVGSAAAATVIIASRAQTLHGAHRTIGVARASLAPLLRHPSEPHAQTLRLLGRNAEVVGAVGLSLTGGESLASLCRESAAAAAATARGRLCEAAARGDVALMRAAIRGGALVGDSDAWGCNALHWAAAGGNADAVDLCLQVAGSMHARNVAGMVPLHFASAWGHEAAARRLVASGAQRSERDVANTTPLGRACTLGDVKPKARLALARLLSATADDAAATVIQQRLKQRPRLQVVQQSAQRQQRQLKQQPGQAKALSAPTVLAHPAPRPTGASARRLQQQPQQEQPARPAEHRRRRQYALK